MKGIILSPNDKIQVRKKHPCSSDIFKVIRIGSDVRIRCEGCGRDMALPRETVEKMIKRIICSSENADMISK